MTNHSVSSEGSDGHVVATSAARPVLAQSAPVQSAPTPVQPVPSLIAGEGGHAVDPGIRCSTSLTAFCAERELSLRSRLEIMESLCALVRCAHHRNLAFKQIGLETVTVEFDGGQISLGLGETSPLEGLSSLPGGGRRHLSANALMKAVNVLELGVLMRSLIRPAHSRCPILLATVYRATCVNAPERFTSIDEMHAAVELCLTCERARRGGQSKPGFASSHTNQTLRWTWT